MLMPAEYSAFRKSVILELHEFPEQLQSILNLYSAGPVAAADGIFVRLPDGTPLSDKVTFAVVVVRLVVVVGMLPVTGP